MDKRDALEEELSKYIDIEVDRTLDYELKIGGRTAVRYNTNIHNVTVIEEYQAQKDLFVTDSKTDNIFNATGDPLSASDSVTVRLDNMYEFTVTYGDTVGIDIDADGDGTNEILATDTIDETNYLRVLAGKINAHEDIPPLIKAYNGEYTVDDNGDEVLQDQSSDHFLMIEAATAGEDGKFEIEIIKNDASAGTKSVIDRHETKSKDALDDVHIEIFDEEVMVSQGSMKAMVDNLTSDSSYNKFLAYEDKLDQFANALRKFIFEIMYMVKSLQILILPVKVYGNWLYLKDQT